MRAPLLPLGLALCAAGCGDEAAAPAAWPAPPVPPVGAAGALLVPAPVEDALAVVDVESFSEVARLPVGFVPLEVEWPSDAAAAPGGDRYYVTLSYAPPAIACPHHGPVEDGGWVQIPGFLVEVVLGVATRRHVQVDPNPVVVRVAPGGAPIYVASHDERGALPDRIQEIDPVSLTVRRQLLGCPGVTDLALASGGETLAVACYLADRIALLDLQTGARIVATSGDSPALPGMPPRYGPRHLAVHPDDGTVWVSNLTTRTVTVHGADDAAPGRRHAVDGEPKRGTFSPDGATYHVAVHGVDDQLASIDVAGGEVSVLPLGEACDGAAGVVLHPADPGLAFVLCEGEFGRGGGIVRVRLPDGPVGEGLVIGDVPTALALAPPP